MLPFRQSATLVSLVVAPSSFISFSWSASAISVSVASGVRFRMTSSTALSKFGSMSS